MFFQISPHSESMLLTLFFVFIYLHLCLAPTLTLYLFWSMSLTPRIRHTRLSQSASCLHQMCRVRPIFAPNVPYAPHFRVKCVMYATCQQTHTRPSPLPTSLSQVGAAIPNLKTRIEAAKAAKPSAAEKEAAELQAKKEKIPPRLLCQAKIYPPPISRPHLTPYHPQAMALGLPPGMPVRMIQQIAAQAGVGDLIPGASQEVAKQPACGGGGGGGGGSKKKKKK